MFNFLFVHSAEYLPASFGVEYFMHFFRNNMFPGGIILCESLWSSYQWLDLWDVLLT